MDPESVLRAFPQLTHEQLASVVRGARSDEMRERVLFEMAAVASRESIRRFVDVPAGIADLRAPIVIGGFHTGALGALGPVLEELEAPVLILRRVRRRRQIPTTLAIEAVGDDEQQRARAFYRAVRWLQDGGIVFTPLDPEVATRLPAPVGERMFQFARGPFALARVANVPIIPLIARWRGARVQIVLGDPAQPSPAEQEMADIVGQWLGRYLTEEPRDISPRLVSLMS
jgi:hypothetical protein